MSTFDMMIHGGPELSDRMDEPWAAEGYVLRDEWLDDEHRRLFESPAGEASLREAMARHNAAQNFYRRRTAETGQVLWARMTAQFEATVQVDEVVNH